MHRILAILFAFFCATPAFAGEVVTYKDGDTVLEGYMARVADPEAPVVIIVHQWMGLGDNEKMRADMLAAQGYNAFAIDIYGQGIRPSMPETAGAEAGKYKSDPALSRRRVQAAIDFLKTLNSLHATRIAVIGYCFGGTVALDYARSGADIKSVISFHGGLASKDPATTAGKIKASIAVFHGADDPYVTQAEVTAFVDEMKTAKADWLFTEYAGAVHAFTQKAAGDDTSKGAAYNEKADKRSWVSALDFLKETL